MVIHFCISVMALSFTATELVSTDFSPKPHICECSMSLLNTPSLLQEALTQICEYSEAGITVRGTYVPPGKEPKDGERPLYLAIEATSEMAITKAKKEITRLIKEELVRLVSVFCLMIRDSVKILTIEEFALLLLDYKALSAPACS